MRYTEVEKAVVLPISSELTIAYGLVLLTFSIQDYQQGNTAFQGKRNASLKDA